MNTHTQSLIFAHVLLLLFVPPVTSKSPTRRPPAGGRFAIVVDERLSALRSTPELSGNLVQRMSRGRMVTVQGSKQSKDGILFYRVRVTRRTYGWIQKEAVISPSIAADDHRLLRLVSASEDFDRLARVQIFLIAFPRSPLRADALLIYADTAEAAAARLSRDAARRLDEQKVAVTGAPEFSYFLNYNGLDRYNRQGVKFVFDRATKRFHYNGWAWREIIKRYPRSNAAAEARKRLEVLSVRENTDP